MYESFVWNWVKSVLNDDAIFVASCINKAVIHEIEWLNFIEKEELVEVLRTLWKCRNKIWYAGQNVDHTRIQIMLDDLVVGKYVFN